MRVLSIIDMLEEALTTIPDGKSGLTDVSVLQSYHGALKISLEYTYSCILYNPLNLWVILIQER